MKREKKEIVIKKLSQLIVQISLLVVCRDGNRSGRPTGAYDLAYDRPGQTRLFS
ncbi:hypothetical protein MTR_5g035700 [Medicago truncatula]|uniref:Uncharacterized protein n=1 Tax=Medicago truncatula TaxID=3880 RepID=G7K476_MEDTR|nr:hypothetical protein MTR_5g035700 [Medicago truncatula]